MFSSSQCISTLASESPPASAVLDPLLGAVLAWWSFALFLGGMDVRTAGAPFPETLPYAPVALGGALMTIFALARCFRAPGKTASEARAEAE